MSFLTDKGFDPNSPEQQKKSPKERAEDEKREAAKKAAQATGSKKSASQLIWEAIGGKVD